MAEIFFSMLVLLSTLFAFLIVVGVASKKLFVFLLAGLLMVLIGASLFSAGLAYETGFTERTTDLNTVVTTYDYNVLSAVPVIEGDLNSSYSIPVAVYAHCLLYGGVLVIVSSLGLLYKDRIS